MTRARPPSFPLGFTVLWIWSSSFGFLSIGLPHLLNLTRRNRGFILEGKGRYKVRVSHFWSSKTHCSLHSLQRIWITKTHRVSGLPSNGSHISPIVRNSIDQCTNGSVERIDEIYYEKRKKIIILMGIVVVVAVEQCKKLFLHKQPYRGESLRGFIETENYWCV
ncbi:uncharacterized protein LOC122069157 [Macadamia integrifolia]|uniref:uncharacterized protein LOC122069157 n=1 Tax=Macadamia integrifolia TaxID=60698 RepID=UPI001C4F47DC|nr:uncharacterized protein LOC122069157 [Macadamia integrifolia]